MKKNKTFLIVFFSIMTALLFSLTVPAKCINTKVNVKECRNVKDGIYLKWDDIPGAERYCVLRQNNNGTNRKIWTTPYHNITDKTAVVNIQYKYIVKAYKGSLDINKDISFKWAPDKIIRRIPPEQDLSNVVPKITGCYNSSKGIEVRWNPINHADSYEIWRYRPAEGGWIKVGTSWNSPFYDGSVRNSCWGRAYKYRVVAVNSLFLSKSRSSNTVLIQRVAPVTITKCVMNPDCSIRVEWTSYTGNKANGYELQYAKSLKDLNEKKNSFSCCCIEGRYLTEQILCLDPGTRYYFRVRAFTDFKDSNGKITRFWSQYSNIENQATKNIPPKYRALIIGNSGGNLGGTNNDVQAVARTFKFGYHYSIATEKECSKETFLYRIKDCFRKANQFDYSVLYYTGHGNSNGLIMNDKTVLKYEELADVLEKIPGKIIVIFDSCYSGSSFGVNNSNRLRNRFSSYKGPMAENKFILIASSGPEELSYEDKIHSTYYNRVVSGGLMTMSFVKGCGYVYPAGIASGSRPADYNKDNKISVDEICKYMRSDIMKYQNVVCYPNNSKEVFMVSP